MYLALAFVAKPDAHLVYSVCVCVCVRPRTRVCVCVSAPQAMKNYSCEMKPELLKSNKSYCFSV